MNQELSFSDLILAKFTKPTTNPHASNSLLLRYQALGIIILNFFFFAGFGIWKIIDLIFITIPADEVILTVAPLQIISLFLMKRGQNDKAAALTVIAIHLGNFMASRVCNLSLSASFIVVLLPGLTYFVSSNTKVHLMNLCLCLVQNMGHIVRLKEIFKVTFSDDQDFQILTLSIVSFLYVLFSWTLFALQKHIETDLWQLAHLNYTKAENITKELVEAIESKDKLVSSFSHEMRNSLNSLNGCVEYLSRVISDANSLKVLRSAKLNGEALLNLINNVLDSAKLKSEKLDLAYIECEPLTIAKKVFDINQQTISNKKLLVSGYVGVTTPTRLYTDPSRLFQVMANVFSNAVKYNKENGSIKFYMDWCHQATAKGDLLAPFHDEPSTLKPLETKESLEVIADGRRRNSEVSMNTSEADLDEFRTQDVENLSKNFAYLQTALKRSNSEEADGDRVWRYINNFSTLDAGTCGTRVLSDSPLSGFGKKGYLKIQISDTGRGISSEDLPHIFNMFYQSKKRDEHEGTGTGLCLWLTKQLCQKMGGDIEIYSRPDIGTTVIFYIAIDNNSLQISRTSSARSISNEKVRVLVVDDYSYNREVHKLILEREGVEVIMACDGKEAVDKYAAHRPGYFSFVMMDIQMPEMDGITAASKIREFEKEEERESVEIYFVSGNYYSKNEALSCVASMGGTTNLSNTQFLRKPVDVGIVKNIVKNHMPQVQ